MKKENYEPTSNVICFDNFKDAALYFDRVLPLNLGRMRGDPVIGDMLVGYPEEVPSRALVHLIDGIVVEKKSYSHADRILGLSAKIWTDFASSVLPYANPFLSRDKLIEESPSYITDEYNKLLKAYLADATIKGQKPIRELFREYSSRVGFDKFSVIMFNNQGSKGTNSDPSIILSKLSLIDTSNADWSQIIEVRKDKESHQRLAKLRLFINKNYSNCSFSYIEDDISMQLYEYELVCKKFGFNTITSTISTLLDSNSLQTSIGAGLIAGLFGGPVVGLSVGAAIEVGKIMIQITEKKHEMNHWQKGHDLAYIFETIKNIS